NGFVDDEWGWNFVRDDNATADDNDHGTLVAGIVGGRADNGRGSRGVVDPVRLMSVKCTDRFGLGTTAAAVQAIQYAVENGATILNASWGGETFGPALYETVRWAGERGVLLVAAGGNAGKDHDAGKGANYPAALRLPNG